MNWQAIGEGWQLNFSLIKVTLRIAQSNTNMITRIEIDGFKSFKDFAVEFAPFTVVAGANASGKTNLFDALAFLKAMAEHGDLEKAMNRTRGVPLHLFTQYAPDRYADEMSFAVNILAPKSSTYLSNVREISHANRLRYILVIGRDIGGGEAYRPYVKYESLETISVSEDRWVQRFIPEHSLEQYLIVNEPPVLIYEYEDEKAPPAIGRFIPKHSKIGQATTDSQPELLSARLELSRMQLLDLNNRSLYADAQLIWSKRIPASSERLVNLVSNLKESDPHALKAFQRLVSRIVPEIKEVDIYKDDLQQVTLFANDGNGRTMTAESLSEGTLRIMLLVAHALTASEPDILLIEEPENGIAPGKIESMVRLLQTMVTDFHRPETKLRQLICTTHSPALIEAVRATENSGTIALLTLKNTLLTTIGDERISIKATRMERIPLSNGFDETKNAQTLTRAKDYFTRSQASVDA